MAVRLLARVCLISAASSSSTHRPLLQLRRARTPQLSLVSRTPATEVLVSRTVTGVDPECVQRVLNATKTKLPSWEQCRSGDDCELPLDPPRAPPILPYRALHRAEYGLLRGIQRTPGLLSPSLAVHYSLLPKVITPLLAIIVWFSSLPLGASLITFVCAADLVNTALKWAVQRPRPRWYSPSHESGLEIKAGNIAWEVDLSFPSAHAILCRPRLLRRCAQRMVCCAARCVWRVHRADTQLPFDALAFGYDCGLGSRRGAWHPLGSRGSVATSSRSGVAAPLFDGSDGLYKWVALPDGGCASGGSTRAG